MNKSKEKSVPNLCTDFGLEHGLLLHCAKELNHLAAILHVYAGGLIFMK